MEHDNPGLKCFSHHDSNAIPWLRMAVVPANGT